MEFVQVAILVCAICLVILAARELITCILKAVAKKKETGVNKVDAIVKSLIANGVNLPEDKIKAFITDLNGKVDLDKVNMLKLHALTTNISKPTAIVEPVKSEDTKSFTVPH